MPVFELGDGVRLPYADRGEGAPVLLVHGWAVHGGFFDDLAARLQRSRRVLTPTLRGHGGAEIGARVPTIEALGEDLIAFIVGLRLERVHVIGWSMGAMVAWAAALMRPTQFASIVSVEMSPRLLNSADWAFGLSNEYGASDVAASLAEIHADWPAYVARFGPRLYCAPTRDKHHALVDWTVAEMRRADPAAMASLWASMTAQDFRAALGRIEAPMLVIAGADSEIYPDGATRFVAEAAPNARRIVLNGAGHAPHLEAPDAFFTHVDGFLSAANRRTPLREGAQP